MKRTMIAILLLLAVALPAFAQQAQTPSEAQAGIRAEAVFDDFYAFVKEGASIRFSGKLGTDAPMRRVEATCYDMRALEVFGSFLWEASPDDEDVYQMDLYGMRKQLFPKTIPGEYRIVIEVWGDEGSCVALDQSMYISGDLAAPRNLNDLCVFDCSQKREYVWDDGRVSSEWLPQSPDDILTVTLPEDRMAEGVSLTWQTIPREAYVRALDANGAVLAEHFAGEGAFTPLHAYYDTPEGTRTVEVEIPGCEAAVSELLVIEKDKVAPCVQKWRETAEKWDLMIVSTHQDDEHLFFGAVISEYAARGKEVGLTYMVDCGRDRYSEALNGLWAAGLTNYPVFLGMRDGIIDTKKGAYQYWGGAETVVDALVRQIRRYKPEVVLTHDFNGEYDNSQHMVTAECVAKAVELAQDPTFQPDTAEKYGVWQTKKLYIHLYEENEVVFNWDAPIEGFGGLTGYEISQMCYNMHRSQQRWVQYGLGLAHDNRRFGLYFSTVGPDTGRNDLFENVE